MELGRGRVDPAVKAPRTLHQLGQGALRVADKTLRLASRMK